MAKEIERKWLLRKSPKIKGRCTQKIVQIYLPSRLRIRITMSEKKPDFYQATLKGKGDLSREEEECELDSWLALNLIYCHPKAPRIAKSRTKLIGPGPIIEVDCFSGDLMGLTLAEVEFFSEKEANNYQLPDFIKKVLVREVTYDPRYRNYELAKNQTIPTEI